MAYQFPPDVAKLVEERMAAGQYKTEDDVLRDALHALTHFVPSTPESREYWATVEAIREGYEQVKAGQSVPLEDVIAERNRRKAHHRNN